MSVCNQNGTEFYWSIKGNELCVLCAPFVYLIFIFFLLWLNMDIQNLITLKNGSMKHLWALPGGQDVFALPEYARAAAGRTGQGWTPVSVHWGHRVGSSCPQAKGNWVQGPA